MRTIVLKAELPILVVAGILAQKLAAKLWREISTPGTRHCTGGRPRGRADPAAVLEGAFYKLARMAIDRGLRVAAARSEGSGSARLARASKFDRWRPTRAAAHRRRNPFRRVRDGLPRRLRRRCEAALTVGSRSRAAERPAAADCCRHRPKLSVAAGPGERTALLLIDRTVGASTTGRSVGPWGMLATGVLRDDIRPSTCRRPSRSKRAGSRQSTTRSRANRRLERRRCARRENERRTSKGVVGCAAAEALHRLASEHPSRSRACARVDGARPNRRRRSTRRVARGRSQSNGPRGRPLVHARAAHADGTGKRSSSQLEPGHCSARDELRHSRARELSRGVGTPLLLRLQGPEARS